MRRRNAAGGSPAAAETSRSQWNRDRCTLDASASPSVSWSSIVSARTATNRAKVSAAVEVMAAILRSPGQCPLDRGCALVSGSAVGREACRDVLVTCACGDEQSQQHAGLVGVQEAAVDQPALEQVALGPDRAIRSCEHR